MIGETGLQRNLCRYLLRLRAHYYYAVHLDRGSDNVLILLQFGGHGHVHKLVPDGHNHAADDCRVNFEGDLALLARLEERSNGVLHFFCHGSIERLKE